MQSGYREDVKAVLDAMTTHMPGVVPGQAFGYPAYKVNGRVFAFVGGKGIALKLGVARAAQVIQTHSQAGPFFPVEDRVWRAWVSLDHDDASAYQADEALILEALAFVAAT